MAMLTSIFRHKMRHEVYEDLAPWGRRIMVENVPQSETMDSLLTAFGQFGLIVELTYVRKKKQAYVVFATKIAAVSAVENTEALQLRHVNPKRPVNSTPAKDTTFLLLETNRPGITAAGLEIWMKSVNDPGAFVGLKYLEAGTFRLQFQAHYLAYRFFRKVGKNEINLKAACGRDAIVKWPEIPIIKLKAVPIEVSKEQIKNAFSGNSSASITHIAKRGYTVYIYFSDYTSYNIALQVHRQGIRLIANGQRDEYPLFTLDKQ